VTLELDWASFDPGPILPKPLMTRALGGTVPGPTVMVSPGDTLKVKFENRLTDQEGSKKNWQNRYSDPDVGNLHFHGGHVSSVLPADDTTLAVPPQGSYDYVIEIPEDHMPGLHWIHPHHHGSTTLHLAGGAASAFIVKDPEGSLPVEIGEAEEQIMVFQYWDLNSLYETATQAYDANMVQALDDSEADIKMSAFFTVNGKHCPTIDLVQGQWQRWRILYAGWLDTSLGFQLRDEGNESSISKHCEMQLLAKDGIYLEDFPRSVKELPVPPGGRTDIMIRCNGEVGSRTFVKALARTSLIINIVEDEADGNVFNDIDNNNNTALAPWTPMDRPTYLEDLQTATVSEGCECVTNMRGYGIADSYINDKWYTPGNDFLHTSYLGAVVQRNLEGESVTEHSYHQHVYPYQISGFKVKEPVDGFSPYFKVGDWHDTWMDVNAKKLEDQHITLRYRPTVFAGKIMVHCHNSMHADLGMLTKEYVRDVADGECQCDIKGPIEGDGIVDNLDYFTADKTSKSGDSNNAESNGGDEEVSAGISVSVSRFLTLCLGIMGVINLKL